MLTTYRMALATLLRTPSALIWSLAFPVIMATVFMLMFSGMRTDGVADPVAVAVVADDAWESAAFSVTVESLAEGEEPLLDVRETTSEQEARGLVEAGAVDGAYLAGADGALLAPGWRETDELGQGVRLYYVDPETNATSAGFHEVDGRKYVVTTAGYVARGGLCYWHGEACWAGEDGALVQGLVETDVFGQGTRLYYLVDGFRAEAGFHEVDGRKYVVTTAGYVARGGLCYWHGEACWAGEDGALVQGLVETDVFGAGLEWYYLRDGFRVTGLVTLESGEMRFFRVDTGVMLRNGVALGSDGVVYSANEDGELEHLNSAAQRLLKSCLTTPSPGGGLCAAWVSNVFANAGYPFYGGDACDMYRWYCGSSDESTLKIGMILGVSSHPHTALGKLYGHVAIYIGHGQVMDNVGSVRTMSLDEWIDFYGVNVPVRWGWLGGSPLY